MFWWPGPRSRRLCSAGGRRSAAASVRPVTFPGFDAPGYGDDWQIEGGWFCHHVWSPEQALLNLFCFSSVRGGWGRHPAGRGLAPSGRPSAVGGRTWRVDLLVRSYSARCGVQTCEGSGRSRATGVQLDGVSLAVNQTSVIFRRLYAHSHQIHDSPAGGGPWRKAFRALIRVPG